MGQVTRENRLWQNWQRSLQPYAVDLESARTAFAALVQAYSSPDRYYHTLTHIHHVLVLLKSLQSHAQNPFTLELAAWFHDAVYNSQASDNEAQSAEYAAQVLRSLNLPGADITTVCHLILCTKHHHADVHDINAQLLLDTDLSILGAGKKRYWHYANAIRQEYAWVPEAEYREGRRKVLETFLYRDRLYWTDAMFTRFEAIARSNLQAELQQLSQE
ncbi:MAG: hypothetical protein KME16_01070 [Scytolyngbya sp. HA4215-MV1]|jgi:predicted metal-dependent HD superfamily phosphohydrolase|nr:hypothetical protein [Scytolyngbya sp. HA4215-MV1]